MTEEEKMIEKKAYLENLDLLQDQLLGLQIVSGQHNDFLNCPLVCGPQHTPVNYTPATAHPSRLSTAPWIPILFSQQPPTRDNPHINRLHRTPQLCHVVLSNLTFPQ